MCVTEMAISAGNALAPQQGRDPINYQKETWILNKAKQKLNCFIYFAEPNTAAIRILVPQRQDDQLRHGQRRYFGGDCARTTHSKSLDHSGHQRCGFGQLHLFSLKYGGCVYLRVCI